MPENNCELFSGLIIGNTKTVMIAAEKDSDSQNSLHFVGFGSAPSLGVDKGVIVSVTDAADSIHFEVRLNAVKIPVSCAADVVNSVRSAGLKLSGLMLKPLASSLGAVSGEEKNAGCISINTGGGATGIVLSGGVSLMQGIDTMLEDFMHVPVRKAKEPVLSMPVGMNTAEFVSEAGTLKYFAEEKSCL